MLLEYEEIHQTQKHILYLYEPPAFVAGGDTHRIVCDGAGMRHAVRAEVYYGPLATIFCAGRNHNEEYYVSVAADAWRCCLVATTYKLPEPSKRCRCVGLGKKPRTKKCVLQFISEICAPAVLSCDSTESQKPRLRRMCCCLCVRMQ